MNTTVYICLFENEITYGYAVLLLKVSFNKENKRGINVIVNEYCLEHW